ncbi:MAG TPA: hypothetical protein VIV66_10810 [Pyrinomonadaceae bacterium]
MTTRTMAVLLLASFSPVFPQTAFKLRPHRIGDDAFLLTDERAGVVYYVYRRL